MTDHFTGQCQKLFEQLTDHGKMVLSTSWNDQVTSRMMSIIIADGLFYFQTDKTFRKYSQLKGNPHAALCNENIQIEGICEEMGRPQDNPVFCTLYNEHFPGSYERYTYLENERLFSLKPQLIQTWIYENGEPLTETFEFRTREYKKVPYAAK